MKISVQQCWYETEPRHRFSGDFCARLAREINARIQPSAALRQEYPRYDAFIEIRGKTRISKAQLMEIHDYGRPKLLRFSIALPHTGARRMAWPGDYASTLQQFFVGVAIVLKKLKIDGSRIAKDAAALTETLLALPMAKVIDSQLDTDEYCEKVRSGEIKVDSAPPVVRKLNPLKRNPSSWRIPKGLAKILRSEGMWESERFDPILLTVMSDTSYQGRDIPLAWQIEFDPFDDRLDVANKRIKTAGIEPDGDGWSEVIQKRFSAMHPTLAGEFHSDSESSTCVLWVESEGACRKLLELVWSLIHPTIKNTVR